MIRRTAVLGLTVLSGIVLVGCGDSLEGREAISGTVKLKGQPPPVGAIVTFEPLENQGTGVYAAVTGGSFAVPRENGLKPGKYLVRVTAGDGKTAVNPTDPEPDAAPGPGGPGGTNIVSKDLVPPDWNVRSRHEVTVTRDGQNKFDFEIP